MYFLPHEVQVYILSNLGLKEIMNCSVTCWRLHQTIANSLILQYRIAQLAARVIDTGQSDLTIKDRLDLLYRFEKNWATLDFVSNHRFVKQNSYTWELVQGVLAFGFGRTWNHPCGIDFTELPSSIRGTTGRTWRHDDLGVNIRDFTIDPGQDLVVIIERPINFDTSSRSLRAKYSVHLLTMSAGLPHPKSGFLDTGLHIALRHEYYSFTFQLTENILIILCLNTRTPPYLEQDHLYIWDWTCGQLLLHKTTSSRTIRFGSFSILSPKHLLIPSFDPIHGSKHTPRLDIYKIPTGEDADSIDPAPLLTFQLPFLHEDARVVSMLTRTDPLEGSNPTSVDRVFVAAPSCSLVVVELGIRSISKPFCCMLFVHASTLLSIALSSEPYTILPWESWGPSSTRLAETKAEAVWIGYVYGNRYVKPLPKFSWHGRGVCPSYLQVWDFNPTPLPCVAIDDSSGTSTIRWVTEASLIPKTKRVFSDHVRTCLRYREITSSRTYLYDGIIIDQDILIGLCPRKESGRAVQGIEVLCV